MLTQWFAKRPARSLEQPLTFRPCLERLEERDAPSTFSASPFPMFGSNTFMHNVGQGQLITLLRDEIALRIDTHLTSRVGLDLLMPTLPGQIASLFTAISTNPLESTALGTAIGSLAFNAAIDPLNGYHHFLRI